MEFETNLAFIVNRKKENIEFSHVEPIGVPTICGIQLNIFLLDFD